MDNQTITAKALSELNASCFSRLNPEKYDEQTCTRYIGAISGFTSLYLNGVVKGYTSLNEAVVFGEMLSLVNLLDGKFNYPGIENIPLFYNQALVDFVSSNELGQTADYNDISFTR